MKMRNNYAFGYGSEAFLQMIKNNHESEMWNIHLLSDDKSPINDYGQSLIFAGAIAVNAIMSKNGCQTIHLRSLLDTFLMHKEVKPYPETLEEFVSMTDELAYLDYTNIIKTFKSVLEDNDIDTVHLAENAAKIGNEELTKIREALEKDISDFIIIVNNLYDDELSCIGYPLDKIPDDKINDAMHYAKDAMINVIKDSAKDIWDIITGQNQINLAPKLSNPEAFVIQQQVFTPVPNYSGNTEIMKHFVIGNNVVIYDPHVQQSFEKDLISLSKRLDKVDKELKLKEPSKFGFVEFISPLNFKAVRLDESSNYVSSSDTDNYISVWTDKATLYISKPSKVTA